MKKTLLMFCLFISAATFAQDKQKIIGKWKVAVMYDADMYYDLSKDSLHVSKDKEGAMTNSQSDSIYSQIKSMMKEVFKDAYFEFKADGSYEENSGMQGDRKGTYAINDTAKLIHIKRERKSKLTGEITTAQEDISYSFNGNRLVFLSKGPDDGPAVEFEKQ